MVLVLAFGLRYGLLPLMQTIELVWVQAVTAVVIIGVGAILVLQQAAKIIEETTEVLSERTKLASGLLQSLGTAFPDMALGVVAALVSLRLRDSDPAGAINYAIIAAATTFGSNIYNIGHAAWCVWRQNLANTMSASLAMFPGIKIGGRVRPVSQHQVRPSVSEFQTASKVIVALSILTALVAVSMVLFGSYGNAVGQIGDIYQLTRPVGAVIALLCGLLLFAFRKNQRVESSVSDVLEDENAFRKLATPIILLQLAFSGIAILFAAESMIHAIMELSHLWHLPVTIAGVLSGVVGCLGEMIVVHNFTIHPAGRLGDAIMGVAMDNIVTTLGASMVAVMGGIFLGGGSLIMIFAIILALNIVLLWQVSELQLTTARLG